MIPSDSGIVSPLHLFFLPFAGGNKYSYRQYKTAAPSFLNIIPLEYPGRGARIQEPLQTDVHVLVQDIYHQIKNKIDHEDYALYGHSLGGLVVYLLTRKLMLHHHKLPRHLFITGTPGPAASSRQKKKRHLLPRKEFMQEIKDFEGVPDELLESEELFDFLEPILRADFKACEHYIHEPHPPLDIPLTVITGMEEELDAAEIKLWQKETTAVVDFIRMPGKHFFIFHYPEQIIDIIVRKLFPNKM